MRARRPHHTRFDFPRNLLKLSSHCSPVNSLCTQDFHLFCTSEELDPQRRFNRWGALFTRNRTSSSAYGGPCQTGNKPRRKKTHLKKRSLGGSCDNAKTLRGTLSPNAGLVAETNFRR